MNGTAVKLGAAGLFLLMLPGGACNGDSTSAGGPITPADKAAMNAATAGERSEALVDDRMKFLEDYVLVRARGGDSGPFTSYNAWLSTLASSISSGSSAPGEGDSDVQSAQGELARYKQPMEETTDVSLMAAYEEGTRLGILGPRFAADFRDRPEETRERAAAHLRARYRLP